MATTIILLATIVALPPAPGFAIPQNNVRFAPEAVFASGSWGPIQSRGRSGTAVLAETGAGLVGLGVGAGIAVGAGYLVLLATSSEPSGIRSMDWLALVPAVYATGLVGLVSVPLCCAGGTWLAGDRLDPGGERLGTTVGAYTGLALAAGLTLLTRASTASYAGWVALPVAGAVAGYNLSFGEGWVGAGRRFDPPVLALGATRRPGEEARAAFDLRLINAQF